MCSSLGKRSKNNVRGAQCHLLRYDRAGIPPLPQFHVRRERGACGPFLTRTRRAWSQADSITKTNIGRLAEYFLATGNLSSRTGLGLTQTSGFTIVADKLNYMVGKTSSCGNNVLSINRCKSHSASFSADPTSCVTFHTFDQFTVVLISQSFEQRLFGNYCQSHGAFYALCILLMVAHVDY